MEALLIRIGLCFLGTSTFGVSCEVLPGDALICVLSASGVCVLQHRAAAPFHSPAVAHSAS